MNSQITMPSMKKIFKCNDTKEEKKQKYVFFIGKHEIQMKKNITQKVASVTSTAKLALEICNDCAH